MISIIICSINKELREAIKLNIEDTIGIEHEIIIIENEKYNYPIAKAYNIAAEQARYCYLCFCHEDIRFYTKSWGTILLEDFSKSKARLIGVLGSTIKTKYPSSVYLWDSKFNREYHLQSSPNGGAAIEAFINPCNESYAEVCVLDGLFIASTKQAWEETKFSEKYLKGFHGYDIDFSLKNFFKGKVIVTYNFLLEHFSGGSFSKEWLNTQVKLAERWKKQLPAYVASVSEDDIREIDRIAIHELLKYLFDIDYSLFTQIKYLILQQKHSPSSNLNSEFLKSIILKKRANKLLRFLFKG